MNSPSRIGGFTLVELMVAIAILAVLALVAYPTYTAQVQKSRRAVAKEALMEAAQAFERCYTRNLTYVDCGVDLASLGQGHYAVTAPTAVTAAAFVLRATATGAQAADTDCATFTITHLGETSAADGSGSANARCW